MKADLINAWLYNEGYKHETDSDGDVHFRYNGKHIHFTPDEDDTYFRLIMPNIYELEDNRVKVLEACNTITRDYKVVKAYLVKDRLWLSIEMFVDSTPEVGDFFERCCRILISAYEDTAKEIFN